MNKSYAMQAIGVLAVFVVLISCKSEPAPIREEVVKNYVTGEVRRKYVTIDGKKEGVMTDYYQDGTIRGHREFNNDMQVGKTSLYYESGKLQEVQYYSNGKIDGGDTVFTEDGKPLMVMEFKEGIKNGYIRKWGPDGAMIYEAKYDMDTLVEVKGEPVRTSHPKQ